MKKPLARFTEFAAELFPHEVYYLSRVQNFQIPENRQILDVMLYNLEHRNKPKAFPPAVDKRKYSNFKKWAEEKLWEANVDEQLYIIADLETKILLDNVDASTEKQIQKWLQKGTPTHFYFRKIYEMVRHYQHFLLIRMREKIDQEVSAYLEKYRENFRYAEEVFQKLDDITSDIVSQYHHHSSELKPSEAFLREVVFHAQLDGMNRYGAFIRLAFLYLNRGDYEPLQSLYDFMDERFREGQFYSKRILANFYANRLLFLSRFNSLDEAEQFGYLSLRFKNADYLFYITNLSAVLLRQGKSERALSLLREAFPEMRQTSSRHNKVGFMAFYVKSMTDIGRVKDAEDFAEDYLKAYPKEVLGSRWHLFFVAYLRALMMQEKYGRVLYLAQRFKLAAKDQVNRNRPSYLPTISWYISVAQYIDEGGRVESIKQEMLAAMPVQLGEKKKERLKKIMAELHPVDPTALGEIESAILKL